MLEIVIATGNHHKFRELVGLLKVPGIRWRSLAAFPHVPFVNETGRTFEANARKKALAVAKATGGLALADDSGLEIEALSGAPGVQSARFAGRHGDDQANNKKLLRVLEGVPVKQRRARYRCVLALADPSGVLAVSEGTWVGQIAMQSSGHHGFGYDPIFYVPRCGKTVGQLPKTVKRRMSHRARAARAMRRILARLVA